MRNVVKGLCMAGMAVAITGCSSLHKTKPSLSMEMDIGSMERDTYVVLDKVEGESSTTSFAGGLIKFVDGGKMILLGMRLFSDQYSVAPLKKAGDLFSRMINLPTTQDRAYFKALAKTPDADVIIPKAYDQELSGLPFIVEHETVVFRGKAIKIKTDKNLKK